MSGNTEVKSFFPFLGSVVKKEGAMSLYDGLSAGITRQIFYATSRFGLLKLSEIYIRPNMGILISWGASYVVSRQEEWLRVLVARLR